jgi:hypothetical protein
MLEYFSESSRIAKTEKNNSNLQEKYFSLSYTPYENISSNKFENKFEKPPPNSQQYFNQHTHVENATTNDEKFAITLETRRIGGRK